MQVGRVQVHSRLSSGPRRRDFMENMNIYELQFVFQRPVSSLYILYMSRRSWVKKANAIKMMSDKFYKLYERSLWIYVWQYMDFIRNGMNRSVIYSYHHIWKIM